MPLPPAPRAARSAGFGLLEVILVFALVIGAAAIVFSIFSPASVSSDVNNQVSRLGTIRANVLTNFPYQRYTGLTTATAVRGRMVPADLVNGPMDGSVQPANLWGGTIAIESTTERSFTITYTEVPDAACVKMAVQGGTNFNGVTINGQLFNRRTQGPLTTGMAVPACETATPATLAFIEGTVP